MAPEIVFARLAKLAKGATVLDPMAGSGTVLRVAAELGHDCYGFDLDPLAVLMSRVWTTQINPALLKKKATELVEEAKAASSSQLDWISTCPETVEFVDYWFEPRQARHLRKLSRVLSKRSGPYADAMRIALSRIIITKERGASLARDTSHSRPHRTFFDNDFDVFSGFLRSVDRLGHRLNSERIIGNVFVAKGDARHLRTVEDDSVDAVVTSPPYLNAIDYLRGHRLSLVWLGHTLSSLRSVRSGSIGSEVSRGSDQEAALPLLEKAGNLHRLPDRELGMICRYAVDIERMLREIARVLKHDGKVVLVVGNSRLKGVSISNAQINVAAAKRAGLRHRHTRERPLPTRNRYLPMPTRRKGHAISQRIRTETILLFTKC